MAQLSQLFTPARKRLVLPGTRRRLLRAPDLRGALAPSAPSAYPLSPAEIEYDKLDVIRSWRVYDRDVPDAVRYFMYEYSRVDLAGRQWYGFKAVRFLRLTRVPRYLRQSSTTGGAMFAQQRDILAALREQQVLFLNVITNGPDTQMVFAYGVQAVGSSPEEAQRLADDAYAILTAQLDGVYQQLKYSPLSRVQGEALARRQSEWKHLVMARGRPLPAQGGLGASSILDGNRTDIESANNQLEAFIRGMADKKFLLTLVSTPLSPDQMMLAWRNIAHDTSEVLSQIHGSRNIHAGVALPIGLGHSAGESHGNTHSSGLSEGVSGSEGLAHSLADSVSHTESQSVSAGVTDSASESVSHSVSQSESQSASDSVSHGASVSHTDSVSASESVGQSVGVSDSVAASESGSTSFGQSMSQSEGVTESQSASYGESFGESQSAGQSWSASESQSQSQSQSETVGAAQSSTHGVSQSHAQSVSESQSLSEGTSASLSQSETSGRSVGASLSQTDGSSQSLASSLSQTFGLGASGGQSAGIGTNSTFGSNFGGGVLDFRGSMSSGGGDSTQFGQQSGWNSSLGHTAGGSETTGVSSSQTVGQSDSLSASESVGVTQGTSSTASASVGATETASVGESLSTSQSQSVAQSAAVGQTVGQSVSQGASVSQGQSHAASQTVGSGMSQSQGLSQGVSLGESFGQSRSVGQSLSQGVTQGSSTSVGQSLSTAESAGVSRTVGTAQAQSETVGTGQTVGRSLSSSESAGVSDSVGRTVSTTESTGAASSRALSDAYSVAMSRVAGTSGSFGIAPHVGVGVSRQTVDVAKRGVGELLEAQLARYQEGVESGAYLYQMSLVAPSRDEALAAAALLKSSFWGTGNARLPQPFHTVVDDQIEQAYGADEVDRLRRHAAAFSPYARREREATLVEPWTWSTFVTPSEAAAFCHPPTAEAAGILAVHDSMPVMAMPANRQDRDLFLGYIMSGERGEETDVRYGVDFEELIHTLVAGATGSGKTTTLLRMLFELVNASRQITPASTPADPSPQPKTLHPSVLAIDWMRNMRNLVSALPEEELHRFRFFSVAQPELGEFRWNPLAIPSAKIAPEAWLNRVADNLTASWSLGEYGRSLIADMLHQLYSANRLERFALREAVVDDNGVIVRHGIYLEPLSAEEQAALPDGSVAVYPDGTEVLNVFTCPELSRLIGLEHLAVIVAAEREKNANPAVAQLEGSAHRDRLQSLWRRVQYFAPGSPLVNVMSHDETLDSPRCLAVSDLVDPDRGLITVIEAEGLDLANRRLVIGSVLEAVFAAGLALGEGAYDHNGASPGLTVVLEEAHEVLGAAKNEDQHSIASRGELYDSMFQRSRALGVKMLVVAQQPSRLPEPVIANCSTVLAHRVQLDPDRKTLATMMNWSGQMNQHVREIRYLGELPVGHCIARTSAQVEFTEAAPVHFRAALAPLRKVGDAELADLAAERQL